MRGLVRQRGTTWTYQFAVAVEGKRRQVTRGGYRTKREAQAALSEALAAWGKGDRRATAQPSTQPLEAYLTGWLEARRPGLKPSTVEGYSVAVRSWISPHLGHIALRDLTGAHLTRWHGTLRTTGGRNGQPLGSRSVQLAHRVLAMALDEAVEGGLLHRSPVLEIPKRQRPTHKPQQVGGRVWTGEEAMRFLSAIENDRLHPLYALALDSGMRRGELAGLRWRDIDLDAARLSVQANRVLVAGEAVEGTPKSGAGRLVDLDAGTVTLLGRWRTKQLQERLAWGEAWTNSGYVFTTEDGKPLNPETISTRFETLAKRSGMPAIRLHDLRHTSATIALGVGVHPKVVQERLGHADISITLDLYSHVAPGMGADAASRIGDLLYGISRGA
jgi:integrase